MQHTHRLVLELFELPESSFLSSSTEFLHLEFFTCSIDSQHFINFSLSQVRKFHSVPSGDLQVGVGRTPNQGPQRIKTLIMCFQCFFLV